MRPARPPAARRAGAAFKRTARAPAGGDRSSAVVARPGRCGARGPGGRGWEGPPLRRAMGQTLSACGNKAASRAAGPRDAFGPGVRRRATRLELHRSATTRRTPPPRRKAAIRIRVEVSGGPADIAEQVELRRASSVADAGRRDLIGHVEPALERIAIAHRPSPAPNRSRARAASRLDSFPAAAARCWTTASDIACRFPIRPRRDEQRLHALGSPVYLVKSNSLPSGCDRVAVLRRPKACAP